MRTHVRDALLGAGMALAAVALGLIIWTASTYLPTDDPAPARTTVPAATSGPHR